MDEHRKVAMPPAEAPHWGHAPVAARCGRCLRRLRAGEAVLTLGPRGVLCALCGRRRSARGRDDTAEHFLHNDS